MFTQELRVRKAFKREASYLKMPQILVELFLTAERHCCMEKKLNV